MKIIKLMKIEVSWFFNRLYLIIHAREFADEIKKAIADKEVKSLKLGNGSVG